MGRPWLPYQRFIADVAGELLPDGTYAYPFVVVQLPRQSGKTTVTYDTGLGRGRAYPDYRGRYSTHKGTVTSDRFADWFLELERRPAILPALKLRRSRGTEGVIWRRTGSYFQAFPARDSALRSAALDLVVNDEAQEHDAVRGEALDRTVLPTFTTRPRGQLWIVFTAGTDESVYAADYLARGIAREPGIAVFDYGCPDDVDPLDPARWPLWHPGLAYGLSLPRALHMGLSAGAGTFTREYACIWTRTRGDELITSAVWAAAAAAPRPIRSPLALGVDVDLDRDTGAIVAADTTGQLEVMLAGVPVPALVDRLRALIPRWKPIGVGVGAYGAPAALADQLARTGMFAVSDDPASAGRPPLLLLNTAAAGNATTFLLADLDARAVSVWPNPWLDAAAATATTKNIGDGAVTFSRRTSSAPIATLVAAAAARWTLTHAPRTTAKPALTVG